PCASSDLGLPATDRALEATGVATPGEALGENEMGEVVLGYGAAVRGILHESQGGPPHPARGPMREAFHGVHDPPERHLPAQKRGPAESLVKRLVGCMDRGLAVSRDALAHVGLYTQDLQAVDGLLRPSATATREEREARFIALQQEWESSADPVEQHVAKMLS